MHRGMNMNKVTHGRKSIGPATVIPESMYAMGWDELSAAVRKTGHEGAELVSAQEQIRASASCTRCAARATEARLRVYLARKEMEP